MTVCSQDLCLSNSWLMDQGPIRGLSCTGFGVQCEPTERLAYVVSPLRRRKKDSPVILRSKLDEPRVHCQRSFEELNRSGRDVRAPGARASRPLTIPQFIPDKVLVPVDREYRSPLRLRHLWIKLCRLVRDTEPSFLRVLASASVPVDRRTNLRLKRPHAGLRFAVL